MTLPKSIFISYRRANQYTALSVYKNLKEHGFDVFVDFQSLDSGRFGEVLLRQVAARAHFVIILTPDALSRCVEPTDWLRL